MLLRCNLRRWRKKKSRGSSYTRTKKNTRVPVFPFNTKSQIIASTRNERVLCYVVSKRLQKREKIKKLPWRKINEERSNTIPKVRTLRYVRAFLRNRRWKKKKQKIIKIKTIGKYGSEKRERTNERENIWEKRERQRRNFVKTKEEKNGESSLSFPTWVKGFLAATASSRSKSSRLICKRVENIVLASVQSPRKKQGNLFFSGMIVIRTN